MLDRPDAYITKIGKFLRKTSIDKLPIEVKAKYDGEYIKNLSIWFDIKICFMTVFAVFTHKCVKEGK